MCPALGVTRQGHYAWRRRGPSARDLRDSELARLIPEVHESSRGIYGAPRVHMELRRRGFRTSRKRVARIMRDNGWSGTTRGCAGRPEGPPRAAAPQAGAAPNPVGPRLHRRRPRQGLVRRHRLRAHPPRVALPGARDGHMAREGRRLVDVRPHGRRAGRRGAQDGDRPQEAARRLHTPLRPRVAVRVAAARPHHEGERHQALDGGDLPALGQRGP